jgi:malate synthase
MHSTTLTYIMRGHLRIHPLLDQFVNERLLPGTDITQERFWSAFDRMVELLAPRNRVLLAKRDFLQQEIDRWHQQNSVHDPVAYKEFLQRIGYLVPRGEPFQIRIQKVDPEIATLCGPQLVVPVTNARFALNACNARWGSLYDALYGSDLIEDEDGAARGEGYNPLRGARVVDFGRDFLDVYFPLAQGSHHTLKVLSIENAQLHVELIDGSHTTLAQPEQFCGYTGSEAQPDSILLRRHGLHVEIQIDAQHPVGAKDSAGIKDLLLEAALTTIMDCEDSVAAVDAEDKVLAYSNWLQLMQGNLEATFEKGGTSFTRKMHADRAYKNPQGAPFTLPGRSLMLVRNVGLHMMTHAVLDREGETLPEGILDALVTATAALHDLRSGRDTLRNSRSGSIYVVKPKMHGPEEVAFTDTLFACVEEALDLPPHTIKIGIMDEERRTTVNLAECIRAARDRVVFINTGFLDRTGDEIHTSMEAGAFARKNQLKVLPWIAAYERWNVATGLTCGLFGKAQVGKGMWAQPDNMAAMLTQKIAHPKAGATTAWVPSPNAATLHAIHYHEVDVPQVQKSLLAQLENYDWESELNALLNIPLLGDTALSPEEIRQELENNCQGILGYVVRWIDQGIGCSKVPDIHNVQLMEDRATLRISSQHIANWLHHGICSREQVTEVLQSMAKIVDEQNNNDPLYQPMAADFDNSLAFAAARDLIFRGREQPNGYTEFLLHHYRQKKKNPGEITIAFAQPGEKKVCGVDFDGSN